MGKKNKILVSENQVIGIREFMEVYLGVTYDGNKKLTHHEMKMYLIEKGKELPKKIRINDVNKEKINNGTYVVVREEAKKLKKGKKMIYKNPLTSSFALLLKELQSQKKYKKLKQIREEILKESNLEYDYFDEVVEKEPLEVDVTVKINRQKVHKKENQKKSKGKGRY